MHDQDGNAVRHARGVGRDGHILSWLEEADGSRRCECGLMEPRQGPSVEGLGHGAVLYSEAGGRLWQTRDGGVTWDVVTVRHASPAAPVGHQGWWDLPDGTRRCVCGEVVVLPCHGRTVSVGGHAARWYADTGEVWEGASYRGPEACASFRGRRRCAVHPSVEGGCCAYHDDPTTGVLGAPVSQRSTEGRVAGMVSVGLDAWGRMLYRWQGDEA